MKVLGNDTKNSTNSKWEGYYDDLKPSDNGILKYVMTKYIKQTLLPEE
jgi:hypothetical protein